MQEMQDKWVQSLGQEDPLEKEMATHCSIFAWEISWTEEPGQLQSTGLQRGRRDRACMDAVKALTIQDRQAWRWWK